jgi:hypothetical protein
MPQVSGDGERYIDVSRIEIHPKYNPSTFQFDFSVIRLKVHF